MKWILYSAHAARVRQHEENLVAVAVEAGLEKNKVESLLSSNDGLLEIEMMERELQKAGVAGVPYYIIDNKYGVSGAQPAEVFIKAFEDIAAEEVAE